jgi:hypothetical protein
VSAVDPALFRLRAFEADWLAPLIRTADSPLEQLLIAEAERWILVGQSLGFFPQAPRAAGDVPERAFRFHNFFTDEIGFFTDKPVALSDFSATLSAAQDDLTPARRAFLRLVLFATDPEFDDAVRQLSRFEAAVAEPLARARLVDEVEWALQGAESQIDAPLTHPARWRASNRALVAAGGLRAAQRMTILERWRQRVAAATGWAAVVDASRERREKPAAEHQDSGAQAQVPVVYEASRHVAALTLGIETLGGLASPLIPRGQELPAQRAETFSTAADNQTTVEVHVVLGERATAHANRSLGRFQLTGIPPAPRGIPQIEVTFSIDIHGTLTVSARERVTSKEQEITIINAAQLSDAEVAEAVADAEAHEAEDQRTREALQVRNDADNEVYKAQRFLREHGQQLTEAARAAVQGAILTVERAIDGKDSEQIRRELISLQEALGKAAVGLSPFVDEARGAEPQRDVERKGVARDLVEEEEGAE